MKWKILSKRKTKNEKRKTEEIIKILLENRGIKTKKEVEEFLNPKKPEDLTAKDVGLSEKEIKKAIKRIKKAIKKGEKIIVYGDYDTDGICGTAILWETLHQLKANVLPFIPPREEGYGLKVDRINQLAKDGAKLIITVDQGIVACSQVEHACKLGIDVIVTDHHVLGERKPRALAIIHTTKLAGCGVAWFFSRHLRGEDGLDLATIGTITDIVPLIGPNRCVVKHGLKEVQKTKRPGLKALYDFAGLNKEKIGIYEVSFIIGPRLNAAGRMEDPMESLRLICTKDEQRAFSLAQKIDQKNRERQSLTEQMTLHAREIFLKEKEKGSLIFVAHQSYQEGIVGLVAGKLMEEFYLPAVVVACGKEFSKASARSIDEFNIIEAIRSCADILDSHGGHPKAAGFTVETTKINILKEKLMEIAQNKLKGQDLSPNLKIDVELELEGLNFKLYQVLSQLEPFGEGNPQPIFVTRNLKVVNAQTVGNGNQHLVLNVKSQTSNVKFRAIGFGMGGMYLQLSPDQPVDLAYNLVVDEWNGQKRLQLKIRDIKICSK